MIRSHDLVAQEAPADYLVLGRRSVKATRRPHRCAACGQLIPVGSSCQITAALADGTFYAHYQHHPYDPACTGRRANRLGGTR
jgi:hypothetical protein